MTVSNKENPLAALYESLISFLADKDLDTAGMPFAELPEKVRDNKAISAAWAAGLIEFGRRHYSICGAPNQDINDNKKHAEEARLDGDGYSWSGGKRNSHKPFRDLIEEEKSLPSKVMVIEKVQVSKHPPAFDLKRTEAPAGILKLRIRLTDKGYASLGMAVA